MPAAHRQRQSTVTGSNRVPDEIRHGGPAGLRASRIANPNAGRRSAAGKPHTVAPYVNTAMSDSASQKLGAA
jgi:hypothetical protein